ncbi:hypothetical protein CNMCM5793_007377 [Aspergillus hiratsukae]|uniref:GST C-terminal domain-containing protein n=1 Tax=Aspergillus hiratsukae TaxID=1194566 RepID=A0A8H6P658_9EURO|nr:hypothetical protein CNMCM5793_007377 [Aspergillus hiratsukae]KAF7173109.1 hypothetical protein CNMCM6106_007252 [Aspergillus hiratsukae]
MLILTQAGKIPSPAHHVAHGGIEPHLRHQNLQTRSQRHRSSRAETDPSAGKIASQPMVLVESAAIIEYFLDAFGGPNTRLVPPRYQPGAEGQLGGETEAWMRYRYYMHYAERSLMSPIQVQLIMNALKNAPGPFFIKPITGMITGKVSTEFLDQELRTHFCFLEDQLASAPEQGPFLCGSQLTAADIQMSIPVIAALNLSIIPCKEYPRLDAYAGEIQNSQGYRRAVEKVEKIEGKPFVPI